MIKQKKIFAVTLIGGTTNYVIASQKEDVQIENLLGENPDWSQSPLGTFGSELEIFKKLFGECLTVFFTNNLKGFIEICNDLGIKVITYIA